MLKTAEAKPIPMVEHVKHLQTSLHVYRNYGNVTLDVSEHAAEPAPLTDDEQVPAVLDDYVNRFGFVGIGSHWRELAPQDAAHMLQNILYRDLVYGVEASHARPAHELTQRFLGLFSQRARFFSNGNLGLPNHNPKAWVCLSSAMFDTGLVCLDEQRIGILWVQDEG
jgi:hypothetical protein